MTRHFTSDRHLRAVKKRAAEHETDRPQRRGADNRYGVKRNACHVLKKSDSQSGSEELVVLKHRNGLDMGNINHSKKAMAEACGLFTEALSKLTKHG